MMLPYRRGMTILVDEARWPWRDTYWCHLVSDAELEELHEFAGRLGCRRVGFQGDHYDIARAIELGAEQCDSREVVRRLKAAGLRLRPSQFTKWSLSSRGDRPETPDIGLVPEDLVEWLPLADGYFALGRNDARALVLFGDGSSAIPALPAEDAAVGRFVRVDQNGSWSIEAISPPPTARE